MIQWILTSSVLILAVLGLRFVLKGKISLRLQYALWAVVALRLLVPFSIGQSPVSAANLSRPAQPVVQELESLQIPVQSFDSAYEEVVQEHIQQGQDISGFDKTEELEYEAYERMEKVSLTDILLWVWIGGMVVCFVILLISNLHFTAKLRKSRRPIETATCSLPVYCAPQIATPCLFGLLRPAIYVTEDVLADKHTLDHVLAHERTHFHHGDHIWAVLRGLCLCIHWYNPLVWLAAKVSRCDAELACDEAAIQTLGEENRLDYGRTLIGLTCAKDVSPLLTATMMTGSKHSIKERITLIAKKQKFSVAVVIAMILALTITAGCTFTGPVDVEDGSKYEVYAFPGTQWGMTYEELLESLEVTEEDVTLDESDEYTFSVIKEYEDVFGAPGTVQFRFARITYGEASYCYLDQTCVIYSDETDMNMIRDNIISQYGEPTLPDAPPMYSIRSDALSTEGHVSLWTSETKVSEYLDDAATNYLIGTKAPSDGTAHNKDWHADALEELEKIKSYPAGAIWWTDDYNWLMLGKAHEEPGGKAVIFKPYYIDYLRTFTRTGLIYPISMPDNHFLYAMAMPAYRQLIIVIFQQQVGAGVTITDAEVVTTKMNADVRNEQLNAEILVYRVSYRLKPQNPDNALILDELVLENGWLEAAAPEYYIVYHQMPLENEEGKTIAEDKMSLIQSYTEAEFIQRYGTEEMLEQYGDMYTAAAMSTGQNGFQVYP